jgi:putative endonuclease
VNWYVYILECSDGSYYTGITKGRGAKCVDKRVRAHNSGKAAKYTRRLRPVCCVWFEKAGPKVGDALRRELAIKKLSRKEKERLVRRAA